MTANKKELAVAALQNGTVIDRIPSSVLFQAVKILGIEKLDKHVTIGNNLDSKTLRWPIHSSLKTCLTV